MLNVAMHSVRSHHRLNQWGLGGEISDILQADRHTRMIVRQFLYFWLDHQQLVVPSKTRKS